MEEIEEQQQQQQEQPEFSTIAGGGASQHTSDQLDNDDGEEVPLQGVQEPQELLPPAPPDLAEEEEEEEEEDDDDDDDDDDEEVQGILQHQELRPPPPPPALADEQGEEEEGEGEGEEEEDEDDDDDEEEDEGDDDDEEEDTPVVIVDRYRYIELVRGERLLGMSKFFKKPLRCEIFDPIYDEFYDHEETGMIIEERIQNMVQHEIQKLPIVGQSIMSVHNHRIVLQGLILYYDERTTKSLSSKRREELLKKHFQDHPLQTFKANDKVREIHKLKQFFLSDDKRSICTKRGIIVTIGNLYDHLFDAWLDDTSSTFRPEDHKTWQKQYRLQTNHVVTNDTLQHFYDTMIEMEEEHLNIRLSTVGNDDDDNNNNNNNNDDDGNDNNNDNGDNDDGEPDDDNHFAIPNDSDDDDDHNDDNHDDDNHDDDNDDRSIGSSSSSGQDTTQLLKNVIEAVKHNVLQEWIETQRRELEEGKNSFQEAMEEGGTTLQKTVDQLTNYLAECRTELTTMSSEVDKMSQTTTEQKTKSETIARRQKRMVEESIPEQQTKSKKLTTKLDELTTLVAKLEEDSKKASQILIESNHTYFGFFLRFFMNVALCFLCWTVVTKVGGLEALISFIEYLIEVWNRQGDYCTFAIFILPQLILAWVVHCLTR